MMININDKEIYYEKAVVDVLKKKLINVKNSSDLVLMITGIESAGKSFLAMQLGALISKYMKTNFSIDNVHFNGDDLINKAEQSPKYTVHILDESRSSLYSGSSNSKKNLKFTHWISESRQLQQIIICCLPNLHNLDKYITKHRAHMWFHVGKRLLPNGLEERGYYNVMGLRKKRAYFKYLDDKYSQIPSHLKVLQAKFSKELPFDEKLYDLKKANERKKKFMELNQDLQEVNFGKNELDILNQCVNGFKNSWRSNQKEYKTCQRVLKKLIVIGNNNSARANLNNNQKGSDNYV